MVIDYLNRFRASICPDEADAILTIYSNAKLALSIS